MKVPEEIVIPSFKSHQKGPHNLLKLLETKERKKIGMKHFPWHISRYAIKTAHKKSTYVLFNSSSGDNVVATGITQKYKSGDFYKRVLIRDTMQQLQLDINHALFILLSILPHASFTEVAVRQNNGSHTFYLLRQ